MQSKIATPEGVERLHRAINSVLGQRTKCLYELLVVADNCQTTWDEVSNTYADEFNSSSPRIRLFSVDNEKRYKNKVYSTGRNIGINMARGAWCLYLDNDDYFANDYLQNLCKLINEAIDWYTVDDLVWDVNKWKQRRFNMRMSQCGTSNIIHKSSMGSRWPDVASYGKDDWIFINNLQKESKNFRSLNIAGYCVCHIPNRYKI